MKTVLFFDYWTRGLRHFLPLAAPLRDMGFEVRLLHLGSWRSSHVPAEETRDGIVCRDIKYYNGHIGRALREERPSVLIGLNHTMLMDRVVRRLCEYLGIKAVYLMHGIRCSAEFLEHYVAVDNHNWNWRRRVPKVLKYMKLVLVYLATIMRTRPRDLFSREVWGYLWQLVTAPGSAVNMPRVGWDIIWDLMLVYAQVDEEDLTGRFSFGRERVRVVGNPNLDEAHRLWSAPGCEHICRDYLRSVGVPTDRKMALYIEGGLVEQGDLGFSIDDRLREIQDVAMAAAQNDMHVVIKMHPAADPGSVLERFGKLEGVTVLCEADLPKLVWSCAVALTTLSTVGIMPIALGRPLIEPKWVGVLKTLPSMFGGATAIAHSTEELQYQFARIARGEDLLARDSAAAARRRWVSYLDGGTVARVVDEVVRLAGGCATP